MIVIHSPIDTNFSDTRLALRGFRNFLFFLVYCTVAVLYKTATTLSPTELGDVGTCPTITVMAAKREVIKFPWGWRLEQNPESWKYLAEGRGA